MSSLADSIKNIDQFKSFIVPGSVFKIFVKDIFPPKEKYVVVIGVSSDKLAYASVLISSEIYKNGLKLEIAHKSHIVVPKSTNQFLQKDSFINCANIQERSSSELFQEVLRDSRVSICGNILDSTLHEIYLTAQKTRTIKPYIIKTYFPLEFQSTPNDSPI